MDIGKCTKCAKRQKLVMPCTSCKHKFCSMCIQLEIHKCSELENKKMFEKEKLIKQNPIVTAPKIQLF
jgi:predicted nucleic acid binding AN1-type Zn finger protein